MNEKERKMWEREKAGSGLLTDCDVYAYMKLNDDDECVYI